MNVEKIIEELIEAVDGVIEPWILGAPHEIATKHLRLRVEFEAILKRSAGQKHAMILEAILRTIEPGIKEETIKEFIHDGDWKIHASTRGEEPHGRYAALYTAPDEMFLEAWLYEKKNDALKKYIDLTEGHDDESLEYLVDLSEYPGDPAASCKIIPVKATYTIEE